MFKLIVHRRESNYYDVLITCHPIFLGNQGKGR